MECNVCHQLLGFGLTCWFLPFAQSQSNNPIVVINTFPVHWQSFIYSLHLCTNPTTTASPKLQIPMDSWLHISAQVLLHLWHHRWRRWWCPGRYLGFFVRWLWRFAMSYAAMLPAVYLDLKVAIATFDTSLWKFIEWSLCGLLSNQIAVVFVGYYNRLLQLSVVVCVFFIYSLHTPVATYRQVSLLWDEKAAKARAKPNRGRGRRLVSWEVLNVSFCEDVGVARKLLQATWACEWFVVE